MGERAETPSNIQHYLGRQLQNSPMVTLCCISMAQLMGHGRNKLVPFKQFELEHLWCMQLVLTCLLMCCLQDVSSLWQYALHVESLHAYARRPSTNTPPISLVLQLNRQKWSCPGLHNYRGGELSQRQGNIAKGWTCFHRDIHVANSLSAQRKMFRSQRARRSLATC